MKLHLPRRRIWRAAIYIVSFLLVIAAGDMLLVQTRRTIRPGFDTTRIVAPLQEDGAIDYLTAIDDWFGAGVTAQNNAAIPVLQALGRQALPTYDPPNGLTDRLGMPPLPEKGDYFIFYDSFCKEHSVTPTQWTSLGNPRPWPVTFDDITVQWVKANEKPLALLAEASKRSRFFIPLYSGHRTQTLIEIMLRHVEPMRDACRALQTRAQMRLAADDVAGFRSDLMTVHRIARWLAQQATMVERVTALVIESSACETERVGISSGKLSAEQTSAMAAERATLSDLPSLADSLDMGERYFALDTLQVMARQGPIPTGELLNAITSMPSWHFGPPAVFLFVPIPYEAAMRSINHYDDAVLVALRRPTYRQRVEALTLCEQRLLPKDAQSLTLGDFTHPDWPLQLFAPALRRALDKEEAALVEGRLTRIALALHALKNDRGAFPGTLAELSPNYLPEVPDDPFSEKPLVYSRTPDGYTLYSVGPNITDDGGKRGAKSSDDIVASLP